MKPRKQYFLMVSFYFVYNFKMQWQKIIIITIIIIMIIIIIILLLLLS